VEAELIGQSATWLDRPAATGQVTTSAKSVEFPHGSINIPVSVKVDTHTHTHHILEIPLAKLSFLVL
jgi:hypothetical protein